MIETRGVSVTLGGKPVIAGLDTQFARGRITAVLGPNGAGKTTLLRAILGLVRSSGSIMLDGQPTQDIPTQVRAQRLGYLPQLSTPSWNLRADEVVMLGRAPHRNRFVPPSPLDFAAVADAMTSTDTHQFAARPINTLSGGEQARVLFARVLATKPDWLLIDEPLNHLDPLHQRNMLRLMRAQAMAGNGVIVVLHDLNAAAQIADDVLLLRDGRAITHGAALNILTPDALERAYDMPFNVTSSPFARHMITPNGD